MDPVGNVVVNWKLKYPLQVAYPNNQTDSIQLAWEHNEPQNEPWSCEGLLSDALQRGLLSPTQASTMRVAGDIRNNVYVKLQWCTDTSHPVWVAMLHLAFVLPPTTTAQTFQERLLHTPRPRSPGDVPQWLGRTDPVMQPCIGGCLGMGAQQAEWRIEIEVPPPHSHDSVTKVSRLHAAAF